MHNIHGRPGRPSVLRCTLCGGEITRGEVYWACNGSRVCGDCFADFARQELRSCQETRGEERSHDLI